MAREPYSPVAMPRIVVETNIRGQAVAHTRRPASAPTERQPCGSIAEWLVHSLDPAELGSPARLGNLLFRRLVRWKTTESLPTRTSERPRCNRGLYRCSIVRLAAPDLPTLPVEANRWLLREPRCDWFIRGKARGRFQCVVLVRTSSVNLPPHEPDVELSIHHRGASDSSLFLFPLYYPCQ